MTQGSLKLTAGQAIDLLKERRAGKIAEARRIALELARINDTVTVEDVREAMPQLDGDFAKQVWMGAVFASHEFEWTGAWHMTGHAARNNHPKPVKVWKRRTVAA